MKRLWILRNLKKLGADENLLLDVYIKQIRCLLEMSCVVWNAGLIHKDIKRIEKVQKIALKIIRGQSYPYIESLEYFNILTLKERRKNLCVKFIKKAYLNEKYSWWFTKNDKPDTRSVKSPLVNINTRTQRYRKSPLPYLTELLNGYLMEQEHK